MNDSNIIDLNTYREEQNPESPEQQSQGPEDLISAIRGLIQRLRESNPIVV